MLQTVAGILVYVVEFDTMPMLPIVGTGVEQKYAEALTAALRNGQITEPGKYGIQIDWMMDADQYYVYKILEPSTEEGA